MDFNYYLEYYAKYSYVNSFIILSEKNTNATQIVMQIATQRADYT